MSATLAHPGARARSAWAKGTAALAGDDAPQRFATVRAIGEADRDAIRTHLSRLDAAARRLRFGGEFDDAWLGRYVDGIDFGRDVVLAVHDAAGRLTGIGEMRATPEEPAVREIAFSVDASLRGRGVGTGLLAAVIEHARRERFTRLHALCATGNVGMLRLLQRAGFAIERRGVEVAVSLDLPTVAEPIRVEAPARREAQREVRLETFTADDGEVIRVARVGAGRPVLLLHGFGCSHADGRAVATGLAEDHEVFAWHARAHWRSAGRVDDLPTLERLGDDLAQLITPAERAVRRAAARGLRRDRAAHARARPERQGARGVPAEREPHRARAAGAPRAGRLGVGASLREPRTRRLPQPGADARLPGAGGARRQEPSLPRARACRLLAVGAALGARGNLRGGGPLPAPVPCGPARRRPAGAGRHRRGRVRARDRPTVCRGARGT